MPNQQHSNNFLAEERTELAIDRTLLAYIRTSLTIVVVGVSSIKFFEPKIFNILGWSLIVLALALFVFGLKRCFSLRSNNGKKTI